MAKLLSADLPADLDLVVLFGSRAKGTATSSSDWDLGVRFSPGQGAPLRLYRLHTVGQLSQRSTATTAGGASARASQRHQAPGLRNRLVHDYEAIDPRRVHAAMGIALVDLEALMVELADRVAI